MNAMNLMGAYETKQTTRMRRKCHCSKGLLIFNLRAFSKRNGAKRHSLKSMTLKNTVAHKAGAQSL